MRRSLPAEPTETSPTGAVPANTPVPGLYAARPRFAVVVELAPSATEFAAVACALLPSATAPVLLALAPEPSATPLAPDAVALGPAAIASVPVAPLFVKLPCCVPPSL